MAAVTRWPRWPGLPRRLGWEGLRWLRGAKRRMGGAGLVAVGLLAAAAGVGGYAALLRQDLAGLRLAGALPATAPPAATQAAPAEPDRARLRQFFDQLVPAADGAFIVRDIIEQAQAEGLLIARGDYRVQPDLQGGFMRYRMNMPVKGDAAAVHRLIVAALRAQPALALESVQFKREAIESREVEARIQWILFTRPLGLPAASPPRGAAGVAP